jgi:hypothetical protein
MPKLTDTQLVILSAASARKDGALFPLPKSLKKNKGAITTVLKSLLKHHLINERPAGRDEEHWRKEGDERIALIITEAGTKAIGGGHDDHDSPEPTPAKAEIKKAKSKAVAAKTGNGPKAEKATAPKGTKQALLIDLLKRKTGATIDEVIKATGWQAHSVRGAISGTLKKKLGLTVNSKAVEGRGRVYQISGGR